MDLSLTQVLSSGITVEIVKNNYHQRHSILKKKNLKNEKNKSIFLLQLTFRDFVPEALREDYLNGKCCEIGEILNPT